MDGSCFRTGPLTAFLREADASCLSTCLLILFPATSSASIWARRIVLLRLSIRATSVCLSRCFWCRRLWRRGRLSGGRRCRVFIISRPRESCRAGRLLCPGTKRLIIQNTVQAKRDVQAVEAATGQSLDVVKEFGQLTDQLSSRATDLEARLARFFSSVRAA